MNNIINILIASTHDNDQKRILAALSEQEDLFITGIAKDEPGVIIKAENLKPDIIILDLQLSFIDRLDLVRIIRKRSPSTSIIILCDNDDCEHVSLAVTAGISGFLLKELDFDKLASIVKIIFLGGCYINSSITFKVFSSFSFLNHFFGQEEQAIFSSLERGIITLLAQGYSDAQIAKELNYSAGTVRNCITGIKYKTKIKTRIEIVLYSIFSGYIRPEPLLIWKEKKDIGFYKKAIETDNLKNNRKINRHILTKN